MNQQEWKIILENIINNEKLCKLEIQQQSCLMGYDAVGLNAKCFIDNQTKEATFIFRGTGSGEWLDNGIAFSQISSPQQEEALEYFNKAVSKLELAKNGYTINVSGHSKGGNKAQYITIKSDLVNKCYSFDGQGFSKEFTEAYKDLITEKKDKIISINAKDDYVHCLGIPIASEIKWYEPCDKNKSIKNFMKNHCPNAFINNSGEFTEEVKEASTVHKLVNEYTTKLMELPIEIKKEVFGSAMGLFQIYLGKTDPIQGKIPTAREIYKGLLSARPELILSINKNTNLNKRQLALIRMLSLPTIQLIYITSVLNKPLKVALQHVNKTIDFIQKALAKNAEKISNISAAINKLLKDYTNTIKTIGRQDKEVHQKQERPIENTIKRSDETQATIKEMEKIYSTNPENLISINKKLEDLERLSGQLGEIKKASNILQQKTENLEKAKENLKTIDKYKEIINKYDNKKILKTTYQKKHKYEKKIYEQAKDELKSQGITDWDEYAIEKLNLEKLEETIKKYKEKLNITMPSQMEIYKNIIALKDKQNQIMRNSSIQENTKIDIGLER